MIDNGCITDGLTCPLSLIARKMAATTVLMSIGIAVQQLNEYQCLNPSGSLVTLAASSRYSARTRKTSGRPNTPPITDDHIRVVRVSIPMLAARCSSGSFWMSGLLLKITSLNHSMSTML